LPGCRQCRPRLPYFDPTIPGTDAPNVTEQSLGATTFIKLVLNQPTVDGDWSITFPTGSPFDEVGSVDVKAATEANAQHHSAQWDISFDGTINNVAWQDYVQDNFPGLCDAGEGELTCDLMPRLLVTVWRVRWIPKSGVGAVDVLDGGFDAATFAGDYVGGPYLIPDSTSPSLAVELCPGSTACNSTKGYIRDTSGDTGLGFKFSMDPDAVGTQALGEITGDWYLAEDYTATGSTKNYQFGLGVAAFVYFVPEPGTLLLLASGLLGLAVAGRRRAA
jgi:hypothetical protein